MSKREVRGRILSSIFQIRYPDLGVESPRGYWAEALHPKIVATCTSQTGLQVL